MVHMFEPNYRQEVLWNKRSEDDIIESIWFDLTKKKELGTVERAIRDDYIPYWTKNLKGSPNGIIGNPYWSKEALTKIEKTHRTYKVKTGIKDEEKLQHEHVIPRKYLCDTLFKHRNEPYFTKNFVHDVMHYFAIGVTITKREHGLLSTSEMPPEFFLETKVDYYMNRWARNRKVPEIKVVFVEWKGKSSYTINSVNFDRFNW